MNDDESGGKNCCPNCGYCPHCGQAKRTVLVVTRPWPPYYPYWQVPTGTGWPGTRITCQTSTKTVPNTTVWN